MDKLRSILIATLLLLAVPAAHLLPGLDGSFVEAGIRNALHFVGFAVVAGIVFEYSRGKTWWRVVLALAAVLVLGVLAEAGQYLLGGQFNLRDLAVDVLGGLAGVAARVCWSFAADSRMASRLLLRGAAVLIGAALLLPFFYWRSVSAEYQAQMPVIADFRVARDLAMLAPINGEYRAANSDSRPVLTLHDGRWAGAVISPVVSDWRKFSELTLRARLSGPGRTRISVLLSDGLHPGFRTQHPLGRQEASATDTEFRFPLLELPDDSGRPPLDIANVQKIYVIATFRGESAELRIDSIRLN